MPKKKAKVEAALQRKGFELDEGDHHYFTYITLDGKVTTIKTKTSHTKKMKEIPDNILSLMAKQCHLKNSDFLKLVDCPLSREDYEALLQVEGLID
ncbi:MAG: hypothetical protein LH702_09580 [Phormidesmis sp. CAN_BIN44]|nr:hypothetical protein [Phormidesmis sp. CAN_BIN44]